MVEQRTPSTRDLRRILVGLVGILLAGSPLSAGTLVGQVRGLGPVKLDRNPGQYIGADPFGSREAANPPNPLTEVVIYLENAQGGRGAHPRPQIVQRNKLFVPRVLPVKVGTTVTFPNEDELYHNVFSISGTKKFDLGKYSTGDSRTVTFDRAGLVPIFCEIHARMKAYVLVFESDAFTTPDERGRFVIEDIPPGDYTVIAWHPQFEPKSVRVQIGPGTSQLDLPLP